MRISTHRVEPVVIASWARASCDSLPLPAAFSGSGIKGPRRRSLHREPPWQNRRAAMSDIDEQDGVNRRTILKCMTWAGTGVLWTIAGGVPRSLGIIDQALAAEQKHGLTFLQISDSHVGFDKPANPNALGTLEEAIAKVKSLPAKPSFMIHTGDISHLSKPAEFDNADRVIGTASLDVHYVPGE